MFSWFYSRHGHEFRCCFEVCENFLSCLDETVIINIIIIIIMKNERRNTKINFMCLQIFGFNNLLQALFIIIIVNIIIIIIIYWRLIAASTAQGHLRAFR